MEMIYRGYPQVLLNQQPEAPTEVWQNWQFEMMPETLQSRQVEMMPNPQNRQVEMMPEAPQNRQFEMMPEPPQNRQVEMMPENPWNRRWFRDENEYLKGLYPANVRRSQGLIDEWFDQYEYPGSPVYDEYPDREWLLRLRDRVGNQARERGIENSPELLYVLLISEVGRRRMANRL